jgi:predicted permease
MSFAVGSFAYPFIIGNFSQELFGTVVLIDFTHFIFYMIFGYIIAVKFGEKGSQRDGNLFSVIVKSPIILTILGVFIVNYSGIRLPEEVFEISGFFSKSFGFLATFLIGISLKLPSKEQISSLVQLIGIRIVILLALIGILTYSIGFTDLERNALLLVFITPFASLPIVFAQEQKTDTEIIAQLAVLSTSLMLIIYPILIGILK